MKKVNIHFTQTFTQTMVNKPTVKLMAMPI